MDFDAFMKAGGNVATEKATAEERESKCLVLFAHGEGMVLTWQAGSAMAACIDHREGSEFSLEDFEILDSPSVLEGVGLYIGEFKMTGHGEDAAAAICKLRPATAEEWEHYRHGEWPWEPLKGSRFYENEIELSKDRSS